MGLRVIIHDGQIPPVFPIYVLLATFLRGEQERCRNRTHRD